MFEAFRNEDARVIQLLIENGAFLDVSCYADDLGFDLTPLLICYSKYREDPKSWEIVFRMILQKLGESPKKWGLPLQPQSKPQ